MCLARKDHKKVFQGNCLVGILTRMVAYLCLFYYSSGVKMAIIRGSMVDSARGSRAHAHNRYRFTGIGAEELPTAVADAPVCHVMNFRQACNCNRRALDSVTRETDQRCPKNVQKMYKIWSSQRLWTIFGQFLEILRTFFWRFVLYWCLKICQCSIEEQNVRQNLALVLVKQFWEFSGVF